MCPLLYTNTNRLFNYLGDHSTNIWLIHMFFYMIYFKDLIYGVKYSFLIFPWLVVLCLASSHIVNLIYDPIIRKLNKISINFIKRNQVST